uniref:Secreted protein n=1 Tax=Achlya hypogyna TaxID=1202772 RepID=A0A0A7CM55_ACHHY|nr:secreted protein [Achlya hypogyna]
MLAKIVLAACATVGLAAAALLESQVSISVTWEDLTTDKSCGVVAGSLVNQGLVAYAHRPVNEVTDQCGKCVELTTASTNVTVQIIQVLEATGNYYDLALSRQAFGAFEDWAVASKLHGINRETVPCP